MTRRILTSIHDVTPAHAVAVQRLWAACRAAQITPALFVVPNWHGAWPLADSPAFVGWIHECVAQGAELFLHGERHDEVGQQRTLSAHLRAVGRTAREGEFLQLDRWHARERIERGLRTLRALDLQPIGFVPPAWLALASTHSLVGESGLAFSEDAHGIHVHRASRVVPAPAVRWSGRSTWRAHASRAVAAWQWRRSRRASVLRLALHPQDLAHTVTARAALDAIATVPTRGVADSYGHLVS